MIYFMLNYEKFIILIIPSIKSFFITLLGWIWESVTPVCMEYNYKQINEHSMLVKIIKIERRTKFSWARYQPSVQVVSPKMFEKVQVVLLYLLVAQQQTKTSRYEASKTTGRALNIAQTKLCSKIYVPCLRLSVKT